MGVVYKLIPQINDFIFKLKKKEPNLSCRKLAALISAKFQIKVSKSSINALIKHSGLSMPVGRRRKPRRRKVGELSGTGAILLKAADYLFSGSLKMAEVIKNRIGAKDPRYLAKTESLLHLTSLGSQNRENLSPDYWLWEILGARFSNEDISSYLSDLQRVKALSTEIYQATSKLFQEVRCLKVDLSSRSTFFLDGQFHTIWSTPNIPFDFSATICIIKSYINKYFQDDAPVVLFSAPGYDVPTKEFFDFIFGLDSADENKKAKISLCGNNLAELEHIILEQVRRRYFLFGLWPWQFSQCRKTKNVGLFRPYNFAALNKNLYIAEIEIELLQPYVNSRVTLRGCAIKTNLNDKIRLAILGNFGSEKTTEEVAGLYLSHWPNLEEAFQDYSRKIEFFTYTAASQSFFSADKLNAKGLEASRDINSFLGYYINLLDLYVRWHFLPRGYENKDFPTIKERFYDLGAKVRKHKDGLSINFKTPSGYQFLKDLQYACCRLNEREIFLGDGRRLWFEVG